MDTELLYLRSDLSQFLLKSLIARVDVEVCELDVVGFLAKSSFWTGFREVLWGRRFATWLASMATVVCWTRQR